MDTPRDMVVHLSQQPPSLMLPAEPPYNKNKSKMFSS